MPSASDPRSPRLQWFLEIGIFLLFAVLLVPAGVIGWVIGHNAKQGTRTVVETPAMAAKALITPAPAFSTSQLNATPTTDWITNGGSLTNDRYSGLDQINAGNVSQLKGVWETHLRGSGVAAKYSGESQPIEYDGIIYQPTGQDDVFAIDADTGEILWEYKANLDQTISVVCCGWESRGVAIGDGKVFIGQLDGKVVALDQKTGQVVWSRQAVRWQDGYSITDAPLYVDGMVMVGASGGEFGARGRLMAFDARTGQPRWTFYTIPGPGQTGHDTWPATGNAWKNGGAPIWQTPSVDPKLGLLYFTTGNAGPDNNGSQRAGKNLFTASMVALDYRTGKLRWWYQMVHHDIWDYDAPSPTILFDAKVNGKTVHGIGEAEKTGWLYLLNRETGKPLFPTPEQPVPQNANQKTWPTQPTPQYAPVVPHVPSAAQVAQVRQAAKLAAGHAVKTIVAKGMYTPYWKTLTILTPGPQGGTNWQPSSYNPNTHMAYVCAQSGPVGDSASTALPAKQKGVAQESVGGTLVVAGGFGQNPGTFSAVDVTTGKIVWQKRWAEACYAGSTTTKGDIVFIGRNDGRLQAYNATNGNLLWNFQTGAGANDAPSIFERNGQEYVVFFAAGNALAASPHGDDLWLFSLDGTLDQVAAPGAGQGIQHAGATSQGNGGAGAKTQTNAATNPTGGSPGDAAAGKVVFASNCSICHGALGTGGNGGPNLKSIPSAKNLQRVLSQVENGGGGMPSFKGTLTQKQINDVAAFVTKDITGG